jgi:tetratricopeptide (TPR) repeat protein
MVIAAERPSQGDSKEQKATIPARTPVLLSLSQSLSTKSARIGDPVSFEVMENVMDDRGDVLIQKGAKGYGHITQVQAARRMGRRATLTLVADRVQAITGEMIPVHADEDIEAKGSVKSMAVRMTTTAAAVGIPAASLWLLKHGHNSDISVGTAFAVATSGEVQLDLKQHSPGPVGNPVLAYQLAFLNANEGEMRKQLQLADSRPEWKDALLVAQADTDAYHGRLSAAEESIRQAVEAASQAGDSISASTWSALGALYEAELGNSETAKRQARAAVKLDKSKNVKIIAALALARSGDASHARDLLLEIKKDSSDSALLNDYWLPTIRAAIHLGDHEENSAIKDLQALGLHEFDAPPPLQLATMYPAFLRGEAFLVRRKPEQAIDEFKKIIDHPGLVVNFPLASLARGGLVRAYSLQGDAVNADRAYKELSEIWKDADPGLPILGRIQRAQKGENNR